MDAQCGCGLTPVVVDHQTDKLTNPFDAFYCAACWGPFHHGAPGQNWEPYRTWLKGSEEVCP
jgi:hypothetical protein